MKIAIIGTSSQEMDTSGPYLYGVLGPCIDTEDGAMIFKLPPKMTLDKHKQVNRRPHDGDGARSEPGAFWYDGT